MKRFAGLLCLIGLLPFLSTPGATASNPPVLVDASIAARADALVDATVLSTLTLEVDGLPHTVHRVRVDFVDLSWVASEIYVAIAGGEAADGSTVLLSNSAPFLNESAEVQLALDVRDGVLEAAVAAATNERSPMVFSIVGGEFGVVERASSGVAAFRAGGSFVENGFARYNFKPPTEFRVNPLNAGLPESEVTSAVRAGFDRWEDHPDSAVDFTFGGSSTKSGLDFTDDYTNVSWQYPSSTNNLGGSLAIAHMILRGDDQQFEIVMNRQYLWSVAPTNPWNSYDIATVIAHEVGHGIGLGHVNDQAQIMFTHIPAGTSKPLGPGDLAGASQLYPYTHPRCNGQLATVILSEGDLPTEGADVIVGTDGNDTIDGLGGNDLICAGRGNDTVHGGSGADTIFGDFGADTIDGGNGLDTIDAGPDDDTVYGGLGWDRLTGASGDDRIYGELGNDQLFGGHGDDFLAGGDGNDLVLGYHGNDEIHGGEGQDLINGQNGDDVIAGGAAFDQIWGRLGDDTITGGPGSDWIWGYWGADVIHGGDGNDRIYGEGHDDVLSGGDGNDIIDGSFGADRLQGNGGDDTLTGGNLNDVLIGSEGNDTLDGGFGIDQCDGGPGTNKATSCE